ncbi:MAG: SDR family oxidoreductase [Synergistaceae bacterium]|jgi:NAD(P)-dependent dehydrogenase (short-subunit alcohol dehydrogenase family)|nr:SDR family oxidoreductase [Synergistaceae bacterium]
MSAYFENKVAVVTGAASGIGLGITEKLLSSGAGAVFMGDLKEENLKKESERLNREYPGKVFPMQTDVTKQEQVEALVRAAKAHAGHLDFVFNNAGMGMTLPTEQITFEIWRFLVDLNLLGVVYGTYSAIPIMREQGFGHIVNAGSVTGRIPVPYQAVYAATKAAVISMTESLQYELEAEGLQFSVYCPANVRTPIFGDLTPPPDSISVQEAIDTIFEEIEKKELVIVLPQSARDFVTLYCQNRPEFEKLARKLAAERRENYRTKGTYY